MTADSGLAGQLFLSRLGTRDVDQYPDWRDAQVRHPVGISPRSGGRATSGEGFFARASRPPQSLRLSWRDHTSVQARPAVSVDVRARSLGPSRDARLIGLGPDGFEPPTNGL